MRPLVLLLLLISCSVSKHNQPETGFAPVKDSRIFYRKSGKADGKALMLVHAGFLDHRMWEEQVQAFEKDFQVITIDLPGHGNSVKGDSTFLIGEAIRAVLDQEGIEKTSIAGLSLGSVSVTDFILAYPERVEKAILISPGINGWDKKYPIDSVTSRYFPELMGALEKKDTVGAAEVFTRWWGDGPYRSPDAWNDEVRRYIYETTLSTMLRHKVSGWPRFADPPAMEKLEQIRLPVLIIQGDKDVPYIGLASAELLRRITGAELYLIKDVAHMLNMEKPKEFNRIVRAFLEK